MKENLVIIKEKDKLTIQSARYIEHGWFITIIDDKIDLYEIPYGGGEENHVGNFKTLKEALDYRNNLT